MSAFVVTLITVPAAIVVAAVVAYKYRSVDEVLGVALQQPDLTPGQWYWDYCADFFAKMSTVPRAAVAQDDGGLLWLTDTPEWDRQWFEARGFEFPARWMPFTGSGAGW